MRHFKGVSRSVEAANKPKQASTRFAKCDAEWLKLSLGGRQLRVLLALSLHADWRPRGLGRCYPKRDTLALTTNMQISHVSEAVRELSEQGLITVVRLGRKNIYYVRPMGATVPMPPSDPEPFFRHLREKGIRLQVAADGNLHYTADGRKFEDLDPLLRAIFSDYVNGLIPSKSAAMVGLLAPNGDHQ